MSDLATLAQAQAFVQDSTTASEAWVQTCLDAASQAVIDFLGVDPTTQTRTELLSGPNTSFLYPRACGKPAPISGVTSITVNPALCTISGGWWGMDDLVPFQVITVDMTTVAFDDCMIYLKSGRKFPRGHRNITLVYTSGYALTETAGLTTMPSAITQAVLYTTKGFFTALGKELNATGESYSGVLSQAFFKDGAGALPPAAQALLGRYQVKMFSP